MTVLGALAGILFAAIATVSPLVAVAVMVRERSFGKGPIALTVAAVVFSAIYWTGTIQSMSGETINLSDLLSGWIFALLAAVAAMGLVSTVSSAWSRAS